MNYELVKKLKDAGFPYNWEDFDNHSPDLLVVNWDIYSKSYSPTLSELIEACGKNFRLQNSEPNLWQADQCGDFEEFDKAIYKTAIGSTPEEAVAELYLSLKRK
ncbi:MAG: hypothetical protein AABY22_00660 [Nanoarchaeota archaeon]